MSLPPDVLFHIAIAPALATPRAPGNLEYLRLCGENLDEAWQGERAASGSKATRHRQVGERSCQRILDARARTRDGLKIKAREVFWARAHGRAAMVDALPDTPDLRAALGALKGVLAHA